MTHAGAQTGQTRNYFIAAEEVEWNYKPSTARIVIAGERELPADIAPRVTLKTYIKAVYHEYTDATFQTVKPPSPEWAHLGMLGPVIRAEVGDTVKVTFKNNTHLLYSMHAHGLAYDKDSEGAYYEGDGRTLAQKKGDAVEPGKTFTYTWTVPERAGPGPMDPSSIVWMYHSHVIESRDMNTGLLGPIIVTRKGAAKADGSPKDVDREFVVAFAVYDETASAYFGRNFLLRGKTPNEVIRDPNFRKASLFYTLNGVTNGGLPMLTMKQGERVRWYLLANSNEDDVHTPHWHGQTVVANMMRTDTLSLGPMMMMVADMVPDNPGTWLFHCHVNDHLDHGMFTLFRVEP